MLKTTLTFDDKGKLTEFLSSQQETHIEEVDKSLIGYFNHDQIELASKQYGATVLQVEDGKPANDASGEHVIEPLL